MFSLEEEEEELRRAGWATAGGETTTADPARVERERERESYARRGVRCPPA